MKKCCLFLAGFIFSLFAHAQQVLPREVASQGQAELMNKVLELEQGQYDSIKVVMESYAEKREAIDTRTAAWENSDPERDSILAWKQQEIANVLNDEQERKWMAYLKKVSETDFDKKYAREHVAKIKDELGLDERQVNALEDITAKFHAQFERMKGIQRSSGQMNPEAFIDAEVEYREAVETILSKEQFQEWRDVTGWERG